MVKIFYQVEELRQSDKLSQKLLGCLQYNQQQPWLA